MPRTSDDGPAYITDDYIRLSYLTGYFAASADKYLGWKCFEIVTRAERWSLTWDKLEAWKHEARDRGVPEKVITPPRSLIRKLRDPAIVAQLRQYQQQHDRLPWN